MTMTKAQRSDQAEAIEKLREWLKPGDTLHTVARHVARSGMTRWIDVYHLVDGEPEYLTYWAAKAIGWPVNTRNNEGVEVGGCGMDMGFHLVYTLSHYLFPDGFDCIGEGDPNRHGSWCPSNDHSNDRGRRDYSPTRHHTSGGYALRQRWL